MALKLDPNNGKSWLLHSKILSTNPYKIKEALSSVKKAKALGEFGTIIESEILENNGKFDAAISVLEEYLLNVAENPEVRGRLSLLLLRNNSLDWSKKVLDEAPVESWEHPALHVMRGRLYLSEVDEHRDNTGNYLSLIHI